MKNFYDYQRDGITQGLLGSWMACRKKAQLWSEGWQLPKDSGALTFGTIVHRVLELVYSDIQKRKLKVLPSVALIRSVIKRVEVELIKEKQIKDRKVLEEIDMCCLIAEATLPEYFKFWYKDDFKKINWLNLEQEFKIAYTTKKGDKTFIRGKKDGVYGTNNIKLFETKTKSMINLDDLIDSLWFELQVNLYAWAIKKTYKKAPVGVNYNIIRKTALQMKVGESKPAYLARITKDIKSRPEFYFMRLDIKIREKDMTQFAIELESMIQEFIDWSKGRLATYKNTAQCITKYGRCPYLDVCNMSDYSRLVKRKKVFNELEDL